MSHQPEEITVSQTSPAALTRVGHGDVFTNHMVSSVWDGSDGWQPSELVPLAPIPMHPGMLGMHYAQVIFEGLKAHRQEDDSIAVFRPWENALRFQRSARRLAMPELPTEMFIEAIERLVAADESWLPAGNDELSLYIRPIMYGSESNLMLRPSREYRFLTVAFLAGGFFGNLPAPLSVWVSRTHSRAMPGGTGDVKCAANYGPSFMAQQEAAAAGCQQVMWLDSEERRWVEEMGGMNLFLVRGEGPDAEVVTPELTGTLLPGVTRDSLLALATLMGYRTRQERISIDRLRADCESGVVTEMFACGTAAVVTPIGRLRDEKSAWTVGDGQAGPTTMALRDRLVNVQHGRSPGPDGWLHPVRVPGTVR
ncbi:branched-chain amino acid aminotransferase [Streptomyces cyaneofuscatus]|uniref:branched-chain amino acid aminotransferase n=1 Tax=Streptomyces cyaneofuscatus TaxID=66883 RepID=UPI0037B551FE